MGTLHSISSASAMDGRGGVSRQSALWAFISAYRRCTGERLSYIDLIQDADFRDSVFATLPELNNPELNRLAVQVMDELKGGIEQKSSPVISEQKTPTTRPAIGLSIREAEKQAWIEYTRLLKEFLQSGEILLSQRIELDRLRKDASLDSLRTESLEEEIREELEKPALEWREEFQDSLKALKESGEFVERNRLRLFDTYIKRGRVSLAFAERLVGDQGDVDDSRPPRFWATPAGLALMSISALMLLVLPWLWWISDGAPELVKREPQIIVQGSITEPTTWYSDTDYILEGIVYVENTALLTIEAGTRVLGRPGSALVVTREASIQARGSLGAPIVFTSAQALGERARGDWGGVVLLGQAPINQGMAQIEGIPENDLRGQFGGELLHDSCGVLEFVRIEFAGFEAFANNELNGLTLGGCGSNSIVRNVQVHMALDDGIEMFGGDVDLKNIVVTGARDDSIDWDMGWTGRVQFLIIQQHADAGDNGFEGDNWKKDNNALPRSAPTFYNVTMLGSGNPDKAQRAMNIRRGSGGSFNNIMMAGFSKEAVDFRGTGVADLLSTKQLAFNNIIIHNTGKDGRFFSEEVGEKDDDGGVDESTYFTQQAKSVYLQEDPMLPGIAYDPLKPRFVPMRSSQAIEDAAPIPQDEFWDQAANYIGAIRPGKHLNWSTRWTEYPAN